MRRAVVAIDTPQRFALLRAPAKPGRAIALVLAACAASQPDLRPRLDNLDTALAAIQRELADMHASCGGPEGHASLTERIAALQAQVAGMQDQLKGPQPPSRPTPRAEPDPTAVYSVPLGTAAIYGPKKAKVTLVMAMDFACPYCRRAFDTVDDLRKKYGADLRVAYKPFVVHVQTASYAAAAACAANHQGKWRELADLLWTKFFEVRKFDDANVDALAAEAKLDLARYRADVTGVCPAEVKADMAELTALGVGATPTFFINGRFMSGAQPIETFEKLVDEELAKASDAIKKGVKPEKYYDQEIVGKGLKKLAP